MAPPTQIPPLPGLAPDPKDIDKGLEALIREYEKKKEAVVPVGGIVTQKMTPSAIAETPTGPEGIYGLAGERATKAAESRWETLQKAAAVSQREPRSPQALQEEEETLRQQYLKAYRNYSSRVQLSRNPGYINAMKSVDWDNLDKMPLEELLKETGKTSQGGGLPGLRDKIQKNIVQQKIGDVDINFKESLLSGLERLLLKETSNAKIKVGDKWMSEKEAQLLGMDGVQEVAWEPTLDTFVIKRVVDGKVKYGLADEKGAALGDLAEMAGATADILLSLGAIGSIPETGPAGPVAAGEVRKWALGRLRDHIAKTATRRTLAEGTIVGGRQYATETGAQEFLPTEIRGEAVTPAPQTELGLRAAKSGALAGAGQGAFELGAKGAARVVKETLDPTGIRTGIVGPAREARKTLSEKYGIELEGMTAAELLPALARAEKTIAEMPFGAKIKEAHQKPMPRRHSFKRRICCLKRKTRNMAIMGEFQLAKSLHPKNNCAEGPWRTLRGMLRLGSRS